MARKESRLKIAVSRPSVEEIVQEFLKGAEEVAVASETDHRATLEFLVKQMGDEAKFDPQSSPIMEEFRDKMLFARIGVHK